MVGIAVGPRGSGSLSLGCRMVTEVPRIEGGTGREPKSLVTGSTTVRGGYTRETFLDPTGVLTG